MTKNKKRNSPKIGTRDAVETAIDMSKSNKSDSWEKVVATQPKGAAKWGAKDGVTRREIQEILQRVNHPDTDNKDS